MKRIGIFFYIVLIFSSCTHRIVRTGYNISKSDYKSCDVVIKKYVYISDSIARKIGEIKLGESGFAVACSEGHAVNILKNEACAINADLIIIKEEKDRIFGVVVTGAKPASISIILLLIFKVIRYMNQKE